MKHFILSLLMVPCLLLGQTRVYVDIVGDLFHPGHLEFIKKAREFGDVLVVGLHPDDQVAEYKRLPILSQEERIRLVTECALVDEVIPNAPVGMDDAWIDRHNIDIVVHGDDIDPKKAEVEYAVPIRRGIFRLVPYTRGISTTEIINRILTRKREKPIRVYVDMVADLFHPGHVEFFKKAREFGDELYVGLISDKAATGYKRAPILTLDERVAAVSACRLVDRVLPDCPMKVTKEWIEEYGIDIVVHGDDFSDSKMNEYYAVPIALGIFRTVEYTKGISTSEIISRVERRAELR